MKYIVYLTINLINNFIYIGLHKIDKDLNDHYLGNGVYANKKYTYNTPKYPFLFAVKKYGPENFLRIILASFKTKEEALSLEKVLVNKKFLLRKDVYNVSEGGGVGKDTSKKVYLYSLEGDFILEFKSLRDIERILGFNRHSVGNSIKFKSTSHGFLWSHEKYNKLDISSYSVYKTSLDIYLYFSDGTLYKKCDSIKSAANFLDVTISRVTYSISTRLKCKNFYISKKLEIPFDIECSKDIKRTSIYQYDLLGKFIKEWDSIEEVSNSLCKINKGRLRNSCINHYRYKNYIWSYTKESSIIELTPLSRKVGIYKDDILIEEFSSVSKFKETHNNEEWVCLKNGNLTKDGKLIKYLS